MTEYSMYESTDIIPNNVEMSNDSYSKIDAIFERTDCGHAWFVEYQIINEPVFRVSN